MKIIEAPEIAEAYINRIRDLVSGRREMKAITYPERGDNIHLSDLQLCPLPAYFKRTLEEPPELDGLSCLRFLRGRVIERAIAQECPSVEVDGISCTIDDMYDGVVVEIKSVAEGSEFFDPETSHPDWLERGKGYLYVTKTNRLYLVVFFLVGNMPNYCRWSIIENGRVQTGYRGVELRAWELTFTDHEIRENWETMLERKLYLERAISLDEKYGLEYIKSVRPVWQCKVCIYQDYCYIYRIENKP
jgi:hypothetical protein